MAKNKISLEQLELERNRKTSPLMKLAFALIAVLLLSAAIFALALSISNSNTALEPQSIETVDRTLSGESLAVDREAALNVLTAVLNDIKPPANEEDLVAMLDSIADGNLSSFGDIYMASLHFPTVVENDVTYQGLAHQSLFSLAAILSNFGENEISPISSASLENIYIDELTGRIAIPLGMYTPDSNPISIELVYIDGQWLIDPYSYTNSIKMSALLQSSSQ